MSTNRPSFPPWLVQATRQASEINKAARKARNSETERQRKQVEELARSAQAQYDAVVKPAISGVLKAHEAWRISLPSNWQALSADQLRFTLELIEETGLCLVWTPRAELIVELLGKADLDAQLALLEAHSEAILDDMETVLTEIGISEIGIYDDAHRLAEEAVAAARDGHFGPAQTTAAAGVTEVLHGAFGYSERGGLAEARKTFEGRDLDEVGIRIMKISLIEICTARALVRTDKAGPGFNRHGSQHGVRRFLSHANSLAGMMLLVAWVRELWWFEQHHPEVFADVR